MALIKFSDFDEDYIEGRDRTVEIFGHKFPWPLPFAYSTLSSSAYFLGKRVHSRNHSRIFQFLRSKQFALNGLFYQFRYRFVKKHQYHIIHTGLEPGYYDIDTIMLHGMMTLLCRYVEDEMGGVEEIIKFNKELENGESFMQTALDRQRNYQQEAVDIYLWWKGRWTDAKKEIKYKSSHVLTEGISYDEIFKIEEELDIEEQQMLKKLVEIRQTLWT